MYWLLQVSFKETINFILSFVNKTTQSYVESGFDKSIEEVEIIIDDKAISQQFISESLWNMYRGSSSLGTPCLLESIHMALEKYLLEVSENTNKEITENWLIYLIKSSSSASITSVVTSVVLAYPDKFFNVAKILFKTSKLFYYDNLRVVSEDRAKILYSIGYGLNYKHKKFEDERLRTCENPHRKTSLENLALNYQFFRNSNISKQESKHRQKVIWDIIDEYYGTLQGQSEETEGNIDLRLQLARIDSRKMKPTTERIENGTIIYFNPEITPDLQKHSEDAMRESQEIMKYSSLKLWATHKFEKIKKYGDYPQYENNPKLVLKETKELVEKLNNSTDYNFHLFNSSIPAFTCSALIRNYEKELTVEDKEFCKNTVLECATEPFRPNYDYQISDGVEVSVNALPFLYELYPEEKQNFNLILLLISFDYYPIGHYKRVCDYTIEAIVNNLWDISFEDAQAIFLGYLQLKPKFDKLILDNKKRHARNFDYKAQRSQLLDKFASDFDNEINNFSCCKINYDDIKVDGLDLTVLETAFQLIPSSTLNDIHLDFITRTLPVFSKALLVHKDLLNKDKIDYSLKQRFFEKFSYFILSRKIKDINKFIQPFVDNFSTSNEMVLFFQYIITAENIVNKYEQFWAIWESFYDPIVTLCNNKASNLYLSEIIHNYLLAWPYWNESTKEWHSLKGREKLFYKKITKDIGHCPSVLDSIAKLLNEIGSSFLNDGIFWISEIIDKNNFSKEKLEKNTISHIERLIRKYIYLNHTKVKTNLKIKKATLTILNYLIDKGSVNGYLLREDIM